MKINAEVIAHTSLRLLNEVGLDGLTMRVVAKELDVKAPALYWHVKNKQELLDAMATLVMIEAGEGLESPRRDVSWEDWLRELCLRLRRTMLRYRDGARVVAGTHVSHPVISRSIELTLRTLMDTGFSLDDAARAMPTLLHYTIGFTIEEQARLGDAYTTGGNPYRPELIAEIIDADRHPLTAKAVGEIFTDGGDAQFVLGVTTIIAGLRATCLPAGR
ncbi:TetR/AcrR family transcriptional regulator C-terminal domain-containing protein [Sphaerisporangium corydalis]|uniref:TetR/AcrR family transcriptional regulator C-terminal domain-containing protein n=1 Tax=Sphaerisporangium corydalis TaxID=1441875 RepID=A0ABV9EGS3_9ACTN|nr:TetR/AcrR family transcriptional regulator C-terminal domain-containing protein [Sphaerisporangium corydalis]